jgi:hypothetical protein
MNEARKAKIMKMFSNCPIVSTETVAKLFTNNQPTKRASAALKELESMRLVEGKSRALGQTKVWRLTTKARREIRGSPRAISFTSGLIDHYLAIADAWYYLSTQGDLLRWTLEPRYPFGEGKKYCPDAFFAWRKNGHTLIGFLEMQLSPLTTKRWAEKWAVASAFFDSKECSTAPFQDFVNAKGEKVILKPSRLSLIAVSSQQPETIAAGSKLTITIIKEISSLSEALARQ